MASTRHRVGDSGEAAFVYRAMLAGLKLARPLSAKESYDFEDAGENDGHAGVGDVLPHQLRKRGGAEVSLRTGGDRLSGDSRDSGGHVLHSAVGGAEGASAADDSVGAEGRHGAVQAVP